MKKFTEANFIEVINKQMEINGYTERYEDLRNIQDWFTTFTTTKNKEEEFVKWLKVYLKKYTAPSRLDADIGWILLNYGLTRTDYDN